MFREGEWEGFLRPRCRSRQAWIEAIEWSNPPGYGLKSVIPQIIANQLKLVTCGDMRAVIWSATKVTKTIFRTCGWSAVATWWLCLTELRVCVCSCTEPLTYRRSVWEFFARSEPPETKISSSELWTLLLEWVFSDVFLFSTFTFIPWLWMLYWM